MKTTKGKIYAARTALAKLANTDAPLPVIAAMSPLLDACEPVIDEFRKLEDGEESDAAEIYAAAEHELPDVTVPMYPGFRLCWLDFRALREIAEFEEV